MNHSTKCLLANGSVYLRGTHPRMKK